jgi:hypothetical protein
MTNLWAQDYQQLSAKTHVEVPEESNETGPSDEANAQESHNIHSNPLETRTREAV